jgi:hypothetical protein
VLNKIHVSTANINSSQSGYLDCYCREESKGRRERGRDVGKEGQKKGREGWREGGKKKEGF